MVNKPKAIGTWGETAVLRVVQLYWPEASRNALSGAQDRGDIGHCGDFIFEVKAGKQAQQIGPVKLAEWMDQATIEAAHSGVPFGILVTQRAGVGAPNAAQWWAHVLLQDFATFTGGHYRPGKFSVVRLELGVLLDMLADQGYTPDAELVDATMEVLIATPSQ